MPQDAATALLKGAYGKGCRHFDTAEVYKTGNPMTDDDDGIYNEAVIAPFLATVPRDDIVVATKFFPFKWGNNCDYDTVKKALQGSLARLGLAYVDVYYCHRIPSLEACLAFVDAGNEYYERNPRGAATPEYARYILSRPGQKDGLYWQTAPGESPSPLGPAYAQAREAGYAPRVGAGKPFHGYLFRVLHGQGASAPGGAYDYVVDGAMTEGFALVAWPARYGSSGVMTFLISQVGVLYEKDLGPDAAALVEGLQSFDPDESWTIVSPEAQVLPGG